MNLRIRKMTVSDLEPLYKLLSNSKVMQYLEAPYTKEQTEQFLFRSGLSEILSIPDGFTPPVRPWKPVIPV